MCGEDIVQIVNVINLYPLAVDTRPVIDRMFALEDIVGAYRYLESNAQVGKVIVRTR
jgi:hypothetical protein